MIKDRAKWQVVFTTINVTSSSEWYFDNGNSRHMIGDKSFFTCLEDYNGSTVTFEDGSLAHVKGKWSIYIPGFPKLDKVLYVDGLKANLLSISQICDSKHKVDFFQNSCEVLTKKDK